MKLQEFKSQVMSGTLKSVYVFVGEEIGIINAYLQQISKQKALDIMRKDTVREAMAEADSKGFFASEPKIYVVRGDKDFQKEEKVWDSIQLDGSMLILLYDKIDSRLKFGKHFKDVTVEFEKLDRTILARYIQKKVDMSTKYAEYLAEICGDSYDVCMLECDKILDYMKAIKKDNAPATFKKLVEDGTIYQSQETDVFAFTNAVCNRDILEAFELGQLLLDSGVSSITALGTLYNSMKAVMLIQCCEGSNIAEITGLDNGAIYYNKSKVGKYDTYDLVQAVKLISKTVSDVKNGLIDDCYALTYVLINIL